VSRLVGDTAIDRGGGDIAGRPTGDALAPCE